MPCYYPKTVWKSKLGPNPNGKWPLVFTPGKGIPETAQKIPCGVCIGCLFERSRQWAVRCVHEASMHEENAFLTLTYREEEIKKINNKLNKKHFVNFMKYLRRDFGSGIRFFHSGEYGTLNGHAHHHVCLFNIHIPDKQLYTIRNNIPLYTSPILAKLWGFGYVTIGDVTFESAAYIARYCLKKMVTPGGTGFKKHAVPEYLTMSRRPGIGKPWYDKYKKDVYSVDKIIMRNLTCRPAKYYDKLYEDEQPETLAKLKERRLDKIKPENFTAKRLRVLETIKHLNYEKLKRTV